MPALQLTNLGKVSLGGHETFVFRYGWLMDNYREQAKAQHQDQPTSTLYAADTTRECR